MTLVHNADADRDTIDHYLGQLSEIQEKQVTMLTMLHEVNFHSLWSSKGNGLETNSGLPSSMR